MKKIMFLFLLTILIYKISSLENLDNLKSKKYKKFCGVDDMNFEIPKSSKPNTKNINSKNRKLATAYSPIRIFVDTTYLDTQALKMDDMDIILPIIKYALKKAVNGMSKLIEVDQFTDNVYLDLDEELLTKYSVFEWDEQLNNKEKLSLDYDYVLFFFF